AVLVRIPEEELARLEGSSGARGWRDPRSLDFRLRHAIAISEVIVGVLERRRRLEIERRQRFDAREPRGILLMFLDTPLPLRHVAREQDHQRVKVGAGEPAHPVIGMVRAGVAEHLRARRHALAELFRKRRERRSVDAKRSQTVERKGDGDPSRVERISRRNRTAAADTLDDSGEPGPSLIRLAKSEESVSRGERAGSSQQEMLNVVQFERHCIWSSIDEKACFSVSAFLISFAVTYGYSPYSRKLGHWCSATYFANAAGFVLQSIGKSTRFSKTVSTPVALNSSTASSVYLSKSVSKMPWYMKYLSGPIS